MAAIVRTFFTTVIAIFGCVMLSENGLSQAVDMYLKNGMMIGPAQWTEIKTIKKEGSVNSAATGGAPIIIEANDGMRTIYFHRIQINDGDRETWAISRKEVKIELPNKELVSTTSRSVTAFTEASRSMPFSNLGRRIYLFDNDKVAVQGITEITPRYLKVEGLRGVEGDLVWEMYMSLDALDPETLRTILETNANPNKSRDYLDIVELYETAKRYREAKSVLAKAIQRFPELESNRPSLKRYDQLAADQLFAAASKAKKQAGQYELAKKILNSIDYDLLSLTTRLKADAEKEKLAADKRDQEELLGWIADDVSKVTDPQIQQSFTKVLEEIRTFLSPDTEGRFADYRRLRESSKPDQRAALAMGGWIYGAGLADDNISMVSSGVKAKQIVIDYLSTATRNDQLLEEIARLESGTSRYVSRIVANMAPPFPTPDSSLYPIRSVEDPEFPDKITETTVPGRYLLETPLKGELQGQSSYCLVQLPPEYNPYRRYPCVVTMHSENSTPEDQIGWWCGQFDRSNNRCWGEASNNGYIVIAPYWARPKQPSYNYTENEHAVVLSSLFDARRRFSIDTDRTFLSGHSMGGSGAWDIVFAHPDLWAGCVVIGGLGEKYVEQYWPNASMSQSCNVPFYFVDGQLTGVTSSKGVEGQVFANERVWDSMLKDRNMDVMITIYTGRGLDHYREELPRIMEWMNLPNHLRNFAPDKFEVRTARNGDKFFWWFEADRLFADKMIHPLLYKAGSEYKISGSLNRDANAVTMDTVPAEKYSIWLTEKMLDLNRTLTVRSKGSQSKKIEPKSDSRTLLRDVRQRADRQHPFWVQIPIPN